MSGASHPTLGGMSLGDLLALVGRLLADADPAAPNTRWTVPELIGYTNEALREILALRPDAFAITTTLALAAGSIQRLPDEYQSLSNVVESVNGHRVSPVSEADFKYARLFKKQVRSQDLTGNPIASYDVWKYTRHPVDDTIYYIEPPVPVGCKVKIKATVIRRAPTLGPTELTKPMFVKPEYEPQVVDWVMQRALSKDHESATAREQAKVHLDSFRTALQAKQAARTTREKQADGQHLKTGAPDAGPQLRSR